MSDLVESRLAIRESFAPLLARGEEASAYFYERLFARMPELRALFPDDMAAQREKFIEMLVVVVDSGYALGPVRDVLGELGTRHVAWGVKPVHYGIATEALVDTLRWGNGGALAPRAERAWRDLIAQVAELMLNPAH